MNYIIMIMEVFILATVFGIITTGTGCAIAVEFYSITDFTFLGFNEESAFVNGDYS
ncbi:MAG: hypothetical protein KAW01_04945 [Deltaproteobacteria bacterium]|nr:hypothetical protein [Deltaproteobacteria bacterium]